MKNEKGEMESKVVAQAVFPEYDAVQEAIDNLGEEKTLEYINAMIQTNEMNRVRGIHRDGPGKKAMEGKAIASIAAEEWIAVAGNETALRELIASRTAKLMAEARAAAGVAPEEESN